MDQEVIQAVRDLAVASGALATATAAWRGLSAWRQQLVGKEQHRIAADLLRAAIRWRMAVLAARSPLMFAAEMEPLSEEEEAPQTTANENYRESLRGYTRRWQHIWEQHVELQVAVVEGEMYLGEWVQQWFSELLTLESKLRVAIEDFLGDKKNPSRELRREHQADQANKIRERNLVLYGRTRDDEFGQSVAARIDELKGRLKKYIR